MLANTKRELKEDLTVKVITLMIIIIMMVTMMTMMILTERPSLW